nr:putative F-box protein At3g52320 [Ipomoea batatas]
MNNPSTSSSSTSITSLPREILLKILTGLPAKSAVRFRCTSKFFYSFIPEPRFAFRIIVSLPSKTPPGLNLYSVSYREDSHGNLQADTAQRLDVQGLVCSADGKMCLLSHASGDASGDDAVFDLSTGRHIWLPSRISWSTGRAVLGFDPVSERYNVFNSEVYYDSDRQRYRRGWVPWMKLNGCLAFINILSPQKAKSLSPSGASTSWPNKINIWTLERSIEWEKQTVGLPLEEREPYLFSCSAFQFSQKSFGDDAAKDGGGKNGIPRNEACGYRVDCDVACSEWMGGRENGIESCSTFLNANSSKIGIDVRLMGRPVKGSAVIGIFHGYHPLCNGLEIVDTPIMDFAKDKPLVLKELNVNKQKQ